MNVLKDALDSNRCSCRATTVARGEIDMAEFMAMVWGGRNFEEIRGMSTSID